MFCLNLISYKSGEWLKKFNQLKSEFLTRIHNNWLLFCVVLLFLTYYGSFLFVSPKYEVYALRFGNSYGLKKSSFMHNANGKVDIAWNFWLVKRGNTNILVDSGFTESRGIKKWGVKEYIKPDVVLSQIGITPEMVSDIILTTGHWDRAGGVHLFPHAKVWIQKGEYLDAAQLSFQNNNPNYTKDIHTYLHWLKDEGRLKLLDGSFTVKKGIKCQPVGGHTNHSQVVIIDTIDGKVILGGSDVYFYENVYKDIPIYPAVYPKRARHWVKNAVKLVSRKEFIIPSYDPIVFEIFEKISPNVVKIVEGTHVNSYKEHINVGASLNDVDRSNLIKFVKDTLSEYFENRDISSQVPQYLKNLQKHFNTVFLQIRNNGLLVDSQTFNDDNLPVNLLKAIKSAINYKHPISIKQDDLTIELFVMLDEVKVRNKSYAYLSKSIDLGDDSIRVENTNKRSLFLSSVPIVHNWSLVKTLYELFLEAGLITDDQKIDDEDKQKKLLQEILKDPRTNIYKIPTLHLLVSQNRKKVLELYGGNVLVRIDEVNEKSLIESLNLAAKWLINSMKPDGSKEYLWMPSENKSSRSNNLVRQLAATGVMAELADFLKNYELRKVAQVNLAYYFANNYKEEQEKEIGYFLDDGGEVSNLGTAAFAIMAILFLDEEGKYARELEYLTNFILTAQKKDGSFSVYYPIEKVKPDAAYTSQRFYSGESLLALMYLYEKTKNKQYLEAVKNAFSYHKQFYKNDRHRASIAWLTRAYFKAYKATENSAYAEFIFEMMGDLLPFQRLNPSKNSPVERGQFRGGAATGVYLEGVTDAYELAKILKRVDLQEKYRKSIIWGLRSLMQMQFKGDNMYYVQNKKKVEGGFRTTLLDNEIRIDGLQHCSNAIMKALKVIEDWKI